MRKNYLLLILTLFLFSTNSLGGVGIAPVNQLSGKVYLLSVSIGTSMNGEISDYTQSDANCFYNSLKSKDWRENKSKTAEKIIQIGGGKEKTEINIPKRFPKKQGEKESHDPIDVIQIPIDKFKIKSSKPEVISIKSKKDIF